MMGQNGRPDLGALLWPRTVAVVGASPDMETLRGRIMKVMTGHPFKGALHPISRSHGEVMGLKAYPSVADLPAPADLAILIIPAQHVPAELERCGKAGVRSAVVLSSGFAEAVGGDGAGLQDEMRAIARRYGMAVMGPNSEGFANTAAALCPTFSPAVEPSDRPLLPQGRERGQLAVIAQSGGIGFSFFDHGRAKELAFRYVVTTGNEACLDTLDFADFILDEGKVSALLMLLEDVKSPDSFRRVAEKALKAGVPIIVNKIGQSEAGMRAAASHTAALAGSYEAHRAMFQRYGLIEGRDLGEMVDIAAGFVAFGSTIAGGKARRHLHGVGRRRRLDGGCLHGRRPRGSAARCGDAGEDRRAPARVRHLAEPRRCHGAGAAQDRLRGPRQVRRGVAGGRQRHRGDDGAQRGQSGTPARGDDRISPPKPASPSSCGATRCRRRRR